MKRELSHDIAAGLALILWLALGWLANADGADPKPSQKPAAGAPMPDARPKSRPTYRAPKTPPTIAGPTEIAPYRLAEHSVAGDWEILWEFPEDAAVDLRQSGASLLWVAPPGKYRITADCINWDRRERAKPRITVTIGTPGPKPDPEPDPTPPTILGAVVVEESAKRTPDHALVMGPDARKLFQPEAFWVVDKDSTELDKQAYIKAATSLPTLFLIDPAGKVWYSGPLPASVDALRILVEQKKGGK